MNIIELNTASTHSVSKLPRPARFLKGFTPEGRRITIVDTEREIRRKPTTVFEQP